MTIYFKDIKELYAFALGGTEAKGMEIWVPAAGTVEKILTNICTRMAQQLDCKISNGCPYIVIMNSCLWEALKIVLLLQVSGSLAIPNLSGQR